MSNKYLSFVSDEHFIKCISILHKSYLKAKNNITKKSFYANKVDTIKLTFDSRFNEIDEEDLIQSEILRQIDKSINNSIGTFHEQILGGIEGFEVGKLSGFDIKATDNTLFADIICDDLSPKFEESIFMKFANAANIYKKSNCYLVLANATERMHSKWIVEKGELRVSHKRVFKISVDEFYDLVTLKEDSIQEVNFVLPKAIKDYIETEQDNR